LPDHVPRTTDGAPPTRTIRHAPFPAFPALIGPRHLPAPRNFTIHAHLRLRPPATLTESHHPSACRCDRLTGFTNAPRVDPGFAEPGAPRKESVTHLASLSTPLPPAMRPDLLAPTLTTSPTRPTFPAPLFRAWAPAARPGENGCTLTLASPSLTASLDRPSG
jgi:hypothetical protein